MRSSRRILSLSISLLLFGTAAGLLLAVGAPGAYLSRRASSWLSSRDPDSRLGLFISTALERRQDELMWRLGHSATPGEGIPAVFGYVDRHSVVPGEPYGVHLGRREQTPPTRARIVVSRVYGQDPGDRTLAHRGEWRDVPAFTLDQSVAQVGAAWPIFEHVMTDSTWTSGYYSVDVEVENGDDVRNAAFVVVRSIAPDVHILLKLATNTYQAYNRFGDASLYRDHFSRSHARMVSFDRPTRSEFFDWEVYYVEWLESFASENGLKVGYATDFDIHSGDVSLIGPALVVSAGHDEYWTIEEFRAFHARIFKHGGSVAFLGGNTAYWQARFVDVDQAPGTRTRGRQLVAHKSYRDPIADRDFPSRHSLVTTTFRDSSRLPESMLMGVAYQSNWLSTDRDRVAHYVVTSHSHPVVLESGYRSGDTIRGVVGYEWDNRDPEQDGKRLWSANLSAIDSIPLSSLTVLLTGHPVDVAGDSGLAEAVSWESASGARVFASGTVRWTWGLGRAPFRDERFIALNRALHDWLLRRPARP